MGIFEKFWEWLFGGNKSKSKKVTIKNVQNQNENLKKTYDKEENSYSSKKLMTECETKFYQKLIKIFSDEYVVQAQIPLNAVVNKDNRKKYANELNRMIDFALFDMKTMEPVVLIELNDKSHLENNRKYRDIRVKEICESAGIPLVAFWTKYPNEESYIQKRINEIVK